MRRTCTTRASPPTADHGKYSDTIRITENILARSWRGQNNRCCKGSRAKPRAGYQGRTSFRRLKTLLLKRVGPRSSAIAPRSSTIVPLTSLREWGVDGRRGTEVCRVLRNARGEINNAFPARVELTRQYASVRTGDVGTALVKWYRAVGFHRRPAAKRKEDAVVGG
jgi:hypothetical protein